MTLHITVRNSVYFGFDVVLTLLVLGFSFLGFSILVVSIRSNLLGCGYVCGWVFFSVLIYIVGIFYCLIVLEFVCKIFF